MASCMSGTPVLPGTSWAARSPPPRPEGDGVVEGALSDRVATGSTARAQVPVCVVRNVRCLLFVRLLSENPAQAGAMTPVQGDDDQRG